MSGGDPNNETLGELPIDHEGNLIDLILKDPNLRVDGVLSLRRDRQILLEIKPRLG